MSKFKIMVKLNKNLFKTELKKEIIYYNRNHSDYKDKISFDNDTITLSGSRTKYIDNTYILETVNSTFYNCLTKSLLFAYFDKGPFEINSITINIDNSREKIYKEDEIKQVFKEKPLIKINPINLFSNKNISDTIMNSLMYLVLSFNDNGLIFDYTWKCFNSLIRDIFKKKQDFEMLKELRKDLEVNPSVYKNILLFSKKINCDYLDQCFLTAMICNNFPKGTTKGLVAFCKDFRDTRVLTTLKEKIKCKKDDLNSIKEYDNVNAYYKSEIEKNTTKDTDIVRLIILKYAYYLRCKYFHAEKSPANFLINNMNYNELSRISIPLSIICEDLIENKF